VIWWKVAATAAVLYGVFAGTVFTLERGDVDWVAFHQALAATLAFFVVLGLIVLGLCSMWRN